MVQEQVEDVIREFYQSWNTGQTNFVFKLHYLFSFHLLSIFTIATSVQLFENNYVNCVGSKGETEEHIDKFAYYFSTFTTIHDEDGIFDNEMVIHTYYFWVPVLFLYQLCIFRWTFYVWQRRGGKLLEDLNRDKSKTKMFAKYIHNRIQHKLNDTWLFQLMFLEFQNILVCVHQWVTANYVLNGKFYQLGLDLSFEKLKQLFPYQTKFTFRTYGPSGSIQVKDYMCILGLNALYKYIFSFYWWWLVILTTLTVLNFVIRIALMIYRTKMWFLEKFMVTWLLTSKSLFISLRYSDWVFMQYLHGAVSFKKYRAVVSYLANSNKKEELEEDMSSESGDNDENGEDRIEGEEQRERYKELLRTIMNPVSMLTNSASNENNRSGIVRFSSCDRHSGSIITESQNLLELVPVQTRTNDNNDVFEGAPLQENVPNSEYGGVSLYPLLRVTDQTDAERAGPETDPLLGLGRDSETGSSMSDESERGGLNFRGKSTQYKPFKKN